MKKSYYNYVGIYTFTYGAMGMMLPLLGQYLDSIGFTGAEIGTIMATGTGVAIFASIFWGDIYNNSLNGKKVILLLCLITSLVSVSLSFIYSYVLFLMTFGFLYFFQSPILALQDSMTLEDGQDFGAIRKWGAIGFALGNLVASRVITILGLSSIFYLYTLGYLVAAVMVVIIIKRTFMKPDDPKPMTLMKRNRKSDKERMGSATREGTDIEPELAQDNSNENVNHFVKASYKELLPNKKFILLLISAFFVSGTNVANNTYFGFLYVEGNGTLAGIGIAFLLMVGSEAFFMAWSHKLAIRFTLEKTILVSMMISTSRYLLYSITPSYTILLATFFLQGMVNGIVLVEFVRYIAKLVEGRLLGMAVSAYYCVSCNVSTIVCLIFGGIVLDSFGIGKVYMFFSIYNLIGVILYVAWGLHKAPKDVEQVSLQKMSKKF